MLFAYFWQKLVFYFYNKSLQVCYCLTYHFVVWYPENSCCLTSVQWTKQLTVSLESTISMFLAMLQLKKKKKKSCLYKDLDIIGS